MILNSTTRVRLSLAGGAALLLAAAVAAPALGLLWPYWLLHALCHQRPDRCLLVAGLPMALCARCFGIYAGALAALLLGVAARRRVVLAALAAVLFDVFAEAAGWHAPWAPLRVLTGAAAGFTAAPLLLDAAVDAARFSREGRLPMKGTST